MKSKICIGLAVFTTALMYPAPAWAAVTFAPAADYSVAGTGPIDVAIGDVDADGNPDLVTSDNESDSLSVLLGNGDGTFGAAADVTVGDAPSSVVIGDFNGDDKPDLATANQSDATFSVLLGNGDGTFADATNVTTGEPVNFLDIGDLNGDGKLDLATANIPDSDVSVLLGNGDGTFAAAVNYPVTVDPFAVTIADLNGDGKPDVVTANTAVNTIGILLGNGDGTLAAATQIPAGNFPTTVAVGDLNDDGKPDLATSNVEAGKVSVLLGNGDGTFAAATAYGTGPQPGEVAIGDLDGDGNPDLAVPSAIGNTVGVLLGNGDGTFAIAASPAVGAVPFSVGIGDLNGDGKPDLAAANHGADSVSVLLNLQTFATGPTASISGTVRQGQTLTADEGSPDPVPDSFTYEWRADGATIGGETARTLVLGPEQAGKAISVTVTAKKAGYTDASDTSPATAAVEGIFTPGPTASIGGLRRVGSTLTANAGSPSPNPDSFAYRWFMDGKQLATKTKTLKLGAGTEGKRIRVKVYALKAGYVTAADLSAATARISNLQAKRISMQLNDDTVARGRRVYAQIKLLAPGEPFSIELDGAKLAAGKANTQGVAAVGFTIPVNATTGGRLIRAVGQFPDRIDNDLITIR